MADDRSNTTPCGPQSPAEEVGPNSEFNSRDGGQQTPKWISNRPRPVSDGLDALRWLLNISSPTDEPDTRVASLMDVRDAQGRTVRQQLEALWEALR